MKKLTYLGFVRNGKLWMSDEKRQEMVNDLAKLKEGRMIEVHVRPLPKRSLPMNKYYWACCVDMVRVRLVDLGNEVDADDTHRMLKKMFNPMQVVNQHGELLDTIGDSSAEMNNTEFMIYLEQIRRWASSFLEIYIPEPNEQTEMFKDDEPDKA